MPGDSVSDSSYEARLNSLSTDASVQKHLHKKYLSALAFVVYDSCL